MPRRHVPTTETKRTVRLSSGLGLTREQIARLIGIDSDTLRVRYETELREGEAEAHLAVARNIFRFATADPTEFDKHKIPAPQIATMMCFFAKTRMRWRETDQPSNADQVEQPHPVELPDIDKMSEEEIERFYAKHLAAGRRRWKPVH